MELPGIGEQCAELTCKQLNFLPLKCACRKCFCSEHFRVHTEQCSAVTNSCEAELKKIENIYRCSFPNCSTTSILPLICERCKQHFCIPHRHIVDCNSSIAVKTENEQMENSKQQFKDAKLIVDKQLDANILQARKKGKSIGLANKIQLMRIKNKALGLRTIPTEERIYFNVNLLSEESTKTLPLFASKTWTIGKTIDVFAQQFKIQNDNNRNAALKLRLFREMDGSIISKNMSEKLGNLLSLNAVIDGETLSFTFVRDGCAHLDRN